MYRKRTFSSSETRGERDLTNLAESETGDELRGFQVCSSSTVDELRSLSIHSVHALHSKWKACCSSHHTVVKKCSSQINEQSRDHRVASLSSKDVSWLQTDKRCIKTQARHKISHHFTSQQANNCNSTEQTNHSQFPKSSNNSLRSKKPPVICKSIQHSTAFLRIFTRFLFAMVLFASLISPSLSSPSISVPSLTSPNLKSWKMVALKTVDYGTESEMNSHRVPIPDVTAIVGRLFRFQIPESAFSERPSVFKVCCYVSIMISLLCLSDYHIHRLKMYVGSMIFSIHCLPTTHQNGPSLLLLREVYILMNNPKYARHASTLRH